MNKPSERILLKGFWSRYFQALFHFVYQGSYGVKEISGEKSVLFYRKINLGQKHEIAPYLQKYFLLKEKKITLVWTNFLFWRFQNPYEPLYANDSAFLILFNTMIFPNNYCHMKKILEMAFSQLALKL